MFVYFDETIAEGAQNATFRLSEYIGLAAWWKM
jgi:hypothetical protein